MGSEIILDKQLGFQRVKSLSAREEHLEKQNAQLRVLLEVGRHINSTLDLDMLLEIIIQVATEVTDTAEASILLLDSQSGKLHFEAATGFKRAEMKAIAVPLEGSIAGWIFTHNQPQVVHDARQDTRHYNQVDSQTKFTTQSIMGVPLRVKERTIGVLEVVNKRGGTAFSDQDIEILETLAAQAAVAIDNARLYQELQAQMETIRQAQDRLLQSEKLVAIGELVAGVAHELNNPLTAIIGFAELLHAAADDEMDAQDLQRIVTQGQRASHIVRSLLDFARQRPSEKRRVQVNDVLAQTLDLFSYELRNRSIRLETHLSRTLPLITADPQQLQQVFVNIISNARQAIESTHQAGAITISTRLKPARFDCGVDKQVTKTSVRPTICISIQDDGPGIPSDILSRIFDPFFTTKTPGKGTGLGLSVCHGIVSEHNGHIWVESSPNEGTTFFVELPVLGP